MSSQPSWQSSIFVSFEHRMTSLLKHVFIRPRCCLWLHILGNTADRAAPAGTVFQLDRGDSWLTVHTPASMASLRSETCHHPSVSTAASSIKFPVHSQALSFCGCCVEGALPESTDSTGDRLGLVNDDGSIRHCSSCLIEPPSPSSSQLSLANFSSHLPHPPTQRAYSSQSLCLSRATDPGCRLPSPPDAEPSLFYWSALGPVP